MGSKDFSLNDFAAFLEPSSLPKTMQSSKGYSLLSYHEEY